MSADPTMREFYDALLSFQTKAIETSAAYNQVIILVGYAAFFAVWSSSAEHLPAWVILASGGLVILSVIVFVAWSVLNMVTVNQSHIAMATALSKGFEGFYERVLEVEEATLRAKARLQRWWIPVVFCAAIPALIGAVMLAAGSAWAVFEKAMA